MPQAQYVEEIFSPDKSFQGSLSTLGWLTGGPLFFGFNTFKLAASFVDPTYNQLNDTMLATPDGPERLKLLGDIQARFAEQLPIIPLYADMQIDAYRKSVQGYLPPRDAFQPNYGQVYLAS